MERTEDSSPPRKCFRLRFSGCDTYSFQKRKLSDMLGPHWSKEELDHFNEAYRKHGRDRRKVASGLRNRSLEMAEAVYSLNKAYLSLLEGTTSVAGFTAMMTDYYSNMGVVLSDYGCMSLTKKKSFLLVIGGDNIEGLLIYPTQLPFKYLEFLSNNGFLISISNDNDIQVWNLEDRSVASSLQWSSNITSFSLIHGSFFMYEEDAKLLMQPYHISSKSFTEAAGSSFPDHWTVVGLLHQPCSSGNRVLIAYERGLIILWDVFEAQVIIVRGDNVLELKNGVVGYVDRIRFPVSHSQEYVKGEKSFLPTRKGIIKPKADDDEDVANSIAMALAKASKKGSSPNRRASSLMSSPSQSAERMLMGNDKQVKKATMV
ncbi:hypothetical protein Lser_V15G18783 [Lactuca serriola]